MGINDKSAGPVPPEQLPSPSSPLSPPTTPPPTPTPPTTLSPPPPPPSPSSSPTPSPPSPSSPTSINANSPPERPEHGRRLSRRASSVDRRVVVQEILSTEEKYCADL